MRADPSLEVSVPRVRFDRLPCDFGLDYGHPNWDISPDGTYFVMIRAKSIETGNPPDMSANHLNLITSFFAELQQKVR